MGVKNDVLKGTWLVQGEEHATLHLGIRSSSPMLGAEITYIHTYIHTYINKVTKKKKRMMRMVC